MYACGTFGNEIIVIVDVVDFVLYSLDTHSTWEAQSTASKSHWRRLFYPGRNHLHHWIRSLSRRADNILRQCSSRYSNDSSMQFSRCTGNSWGNGSFNLDTPQSCRHDTNSYKSLVELHQQGRNRKPSCCWASRAFRPEAYAR